MVWHGIVWLQETEEIEIKTNNDILNNNIIVCKYTDAMVYVEDRRKPSVVFVLALTHNGRESERGRESDKYAAHTYNVTHIYTLDPNIPLQKTEDEKEEKSIVNRKENPEICWLK